MSASVSNTYGPAHDPMCPRCNHDPADCFKTHGSLPITFWDGKQYCQLPCQCRLIARVREDERTRVVCEFMSNHGDREIYAAALRDAAAWLRDSQHHPSDEAAAWAYAYAEAIEALGGER